MLLLSSTGDVAVSQRPEVAITSEKTEELTKEMR